MGQKGTGRRLSDQERMEIIARLEGDRPRASAADCARQYGVSSAAITKLMKMKDKIKQRFKENNTFSLQRKRGGTERHAAFEDELFQWITMHQQEQQAAAIAAATAMPAIEADQQPSVDAVVAAVQPVQKGPLTAAKVQQKAQDLLKAHDLGSFRASKGWYYRFCRRYGLSQTTLNADDGDHDGNDDGLDHSDSDTDGSLDMDSHGDATAQGGAAAAAAGNGASGESKVKRKASSSSSRAGKKTKQGSKGWSGVESLQSTLAKAAVALDHPEARVYLGENAAGEMLRSIQQSIGVVQCIRLKKTTNDIAVDAKEESQAATISPAVVDAVEHTTGDVVV